MWQAIGFVLRYGPLIVAGIQAVENFVRPGTPKEKKLELAMRFISQSLIALGVVVNARIEEILVQVITLMITVFNAFGIFQSAQGIDEDAMEVSSDNVVAVQIPQEENDAEFDRLTKLLQR